MHEPGGSQNRPPKPSEPPYLAVSSLATRVVSDGVVFSGRMTM